MERKLFQLFDRQRFQQNPRLAAVISDVDGRYAGALTDDELEMVSAAGDASAIAARDDKYINPLAIDTPARGKR